MTTHSWLAGLAMVLACNIPAQANTYQASTRFLTALGMNSFGAAEGLHADLIADQPRDERGVLVADIYLDFRSLIACEHDPNGHPTRAAFSQPQNSPECRKSQQDRLDRWDARYPGSVLAAIARNAVEVYLARLLPVTDAEAEEARQRHLSRALQALESVSARSRTPNWYVARMELATLQGWGRKRFWPLLEEAAAKFPDHAAIYEAATVHFLPRYGGSYEEVDEVAKFAAAKSRSSYGDAMYALVYDTLVHGKGLTGNPGFVASLVSWPRMRAGFLDLHKRHPNAWTHNRLAQYACFVRDMPLLSRLIADPEAAQPDGWLGDGNVRCRKVVEVTQEKV